MALPLHRRSPFILFFSGFIFLILGVFFPLFLFLCHSPALPEARAAQAQCIFSGMSKPYLLAFLSFQVIVPHWVFLFCSPLYMENSRGQFVPRLLSQLECVGQSAHIDPHSVFFFLLPPPRVCNAAKKWLFVISHATSLNCLLIWFFLSLLS